MTQRRHRRMPHDFENLVALATNRVARLGDRATKHNQSPSSCCSWRGSLRNADPDIDHDALANALGDASHMIEKFSVTARTKARGAPLSKSGGVSRHCFTASMAANPR